MDRQLNGFTLTFDVDGVIARTIKNKYLESQPFDFAIKHINKFYNDGFVINLYTARYGSRCKGNIHEIYNKAFIELKEWADKNGLLYDSIYCAKPVSSLFIDDRAVKVDSTKGEEDWINNLLPAIQGLSEVDEFNQPIPEFERMSEKMVEFKQEER